MKTTTATMLMFLVAVVATAQEHAKVDSAKPLPVFSIDAGRATGNTVFFLPSVLPYNEFLDESPLFALWKQTAIPPPLIGSIAEPKADLLAPLRDQWARQEQMKTFRAVLGSVQIGAVGYLAYRALTSKETPKPIKRK